MQDILPSDKAKNFSNLALLAMQNSRCAFQNRLFVWAMYEIDPYHVRGVVLQKWGDGGKLFLD
jgi:hypothetical protein